MMLMMLQLLVSEKYFYKQLHKSLFISGNLIFFLTSQLVSDIWSLGVILYMLVCGSAPFQEANDSETLTMIMDCNYIVRY